MNRFWSGIRDKLEVVEETGHGEGQEDVEKYWPGELAILLNGVEKTVEGVIAVEPIEKSDVGYELCNKLGIAIWSHGFPLLSRSLAVDEKFDLDLGV
jgi:hypothetical protein